MKPAFIPGGLLLPDGKGEKESLAPNGNSPHKTLNRIVEYIKL